MTPEPEAEHNRGDRRLQHLLALVVVLEASMYSVLTPLLPRLVDEYDLSQTHAGVLFSSYVLGSAVGALLGVRVLAAFGPRRALQIALTMMVVSLVGFTFHSSFEVSAALRLVGGAGGGMSWVAALAWAIELGGRGRRSEVIGRIMGASVFGTLVGPVIGSLAVLSGRAAVFVGVAVVALVAAGLVEKERWSSDPSRHTDEIRPGGAIRTTIVSRAGWELVLLAVSYGTLFVLLPLRLSQAGVADVWIGVVFAVCSGLSALVTGAIGKWSDRVDGARVHHLAMGVSVAFLGALAFDLNVVADIVIIVGGVGLVLSAQITPASTAVSNVAERRGASTGVVSMVLLLCFSVGESVGGTIGPLLADHLTSSFVFVALGVAMAGTLVLHRSPSDPAPA